MNLHIPTWVIVVFVLLLVFGLRLSRPRAMHPTVPVLTAAGFVVFSLYGVVSAFGASPFALLAWAAGLLATAVAGRRFFAPAAVSRVVGSPKILVAGSWLPLALMMGIFAAKFFIGVARGAQLPVGTQPWFAPTLGFVLGALSGGFSARALEIRRLARSA